MTQRIVEYRASGNVPGTLPRGQVAEWLCCGLQSRLRRFDSDPGLQLTPSWGFFTPQFSVFESLKPLLYLRLRGSGVTWSQMTRDHQKVVDLGVFEKVLPENATHADLILTAVSILRGFDVAI